MRIFCRKALVFERQGEIFRTEPMGFAELPEHFSESLLFQWALKDGDIEVIGDSLKRKKVEAEPGKPSVKRGRGAMTKEEVRPDGGEAL